MTESSSGDDSRSVEKLRSLLAEAEAERDRALAIAAAKDRVIQAQKEVIDLSSQPRPAGSGFERSRASLDRPEGAARQGARDETTNHANGAKTFEPATGGRDPTRVLPSASMKGGILVVVFGLIANPVAFFFLYLFFVIPTYVLPYFGSNSLLVGGALSFSNGSNPFFWMHVLCFTCLTALTWWRGYATHSIWITLFPVLGGIFDLVPGFTLIFLLPTLMHCLALIFGVKQKASDSAAIRAGFAFPFWVGTIAIATLVFAVGISLDVVSSAGVNRVVKSVTDIKQSAKVAQSSPAVNRSAPSQAPVPADERSFAPVSLVGLPRWGHPDNLLVVDTTKGRFIIHLRRDISPRHADRLKELVRQKFYDNQSFNHVIEGQIVLNDRVLRDQQLTPELFNVPFLRGYVGMNHENGIGVPFDDTGFFIVLRPNRLLDGNCTIVGEVVAGMEVADQLRGQDPSDASVNPDSILRMRVAADIM
jgi:peptidylprolyl isomerase